MKFNPLDVSYFSHDDRKGQTPSFDLPIDQAFEYVYGKSYLERNQSKKISSYASPLIHPLFLKINELKQTPMKNLDAENSKCDEVFADYIVKMANYVNPAFMTRLLKFITLFRECVNIINKEKVRSDSKDYTEITNAEDVPDVSNDFITEFLDPDTNIFEFGKEEAIDLTQNFCHWLYENNYTCSKLSLISNY